MPNYCSCRILITGNSLPEFKQTMNTPNYDGTIVEFSFYQTVPGPKILTGFHPFDNIWGTKWDAHNTNIKITDTEVSIQVDTAWSPPTLWAESCIKKFQDLHITIAYCESGMEYYGVWKDGNDQYYEFNEQDLTPELKLGGNLKKHIKKYQIGLGG